MIGFTSGLAKILQQRPPSLHNMPVPSPNLQLSQNSTCIAKVHYVNAAF